MQAHRLNAGAITLARQLLKRKQAVRTQRFSLYRHGQPQGAPAVEQEICKRFMNGAATFGRLAFTGL